MLQENKIIELLPQVLSGDRLIEELGYLPAYNETIIEQSQASRLLALSDIYRVYVPSEMSIEIYNKLYLALLLSIKKKFTAAAVKQRYENAKMIKRMDSVGIIGGSDSFTIIGSSGIGKSSAIEKSIGLLTENAIIQDDELIGNVIPCLVVQCPFDSSVKSLLLEILRKTDEVLETNYYESAKKSRYTTTDVLIGSVSTIALNHIGLLIVDEIQNVVNSKNGKSLIGSLTQLINNTDNFMSDNSIVLFVCTRFRIKVNILTKSSLNSLPTIVCIVKAMIDYFCLLRTVIITKLIFFTHEQTSLIHNHILIVCSIYNFLVSKV